MWLPSLWLGNIRYGKSMFEEKDSELVWDFFWGGDISGTSRWNSSKHGFIKKRSRTKEI